MSKTVLVTGGAGFIGAHLSKFLSHQGFKVIILDKIETHKANLQYLGVEAELLFRDVSDPHGLDILENRCIDIIFHLASQANVPQSVRNPRADFNTNALGTFNVLEFARKNKISKVVFPSTVSIYAPDVKMPIKENYPTRASSPYGASKVAAENYCFAYSKSYNLNVTVMRLFNVFGPLMSKYVIHDLVRKLQKNPKHLSILGDGKQKREYLYIDDVIRAFLIVAELGLPGEVYNVGTGNPIRIRELADKIIKTMGLENVEIEYTMESWPGDIKEWYADTSKIQELGFSPNVSWDEGLRNTISFLEQFPNGV